MTTERSLQQLPVLGYIAAGIFALSIFAFGMKAHAFQSANVNANASSGINSTTSGTSGNVSVTSQTSSGGLSNQNSSSSNSANTIVDSTNNSTAVNDISVRQHCTGTFFFGLCFGQKANVNANSASGINSATTGDATNVDTNVQNCGPGLCNQMQNSANGANTIVGSTNNSTSLNLIRIRQRMVPPTP